jgi:hypothetical protein
VLVPLQDCISQEQSHIYVTFKPDHTLADSTMPCLLACKANLLDQDKRSETEARTSQYFLEIRVKAWLRRLAYNLLCTMKKLRALNH